MKHPSVSVGTPQEYAFWVDRWRRFLSEAGAGPDSLEQVDARFNYRENRITLYRLPVSSDEGSVAETISHEMLHSLLFQLGERDAARQIDLVSQPVRSGRRIGGI